MFLLLAVFGDHKEITSFYELLWFTKNEATQQSLPQG